ncbi:unnamed protein product [Symbiodinium sp. CCMP2456]|nr:unnamed protein product [Symbiodinium sp. CCMP2456]
MAALAVLEPSWRGFRTFEAPPPGCVLWLNEEAEEQRRPSLLDLPSPRQAKEAREDPGNNLGPLQNAEHLHEAEKADLEALAERDPALKEILEQDAAIGQDAAADAAFELYRQSLIALDAGQMLTQKAFKCVARDNAEDLRRLFETTSLRWDAENAGGQTLIEVALERQPLDFPTRGDLPGLSECREQFVICHDEVIKEMRRKQENEESGTAAGDQDPTDSSLPKATDAKSEEVTEPGRGAQEPTPAD